jgi:hypothetical protein
LCVVALLFWYSCVEYVEGELEVDWREREGLRKKMREEKEEKNGKRMLNSKVHALTRVPSLSVCTANLSISSNEKEQVKKESKFTRDKNAIASHVQRPFIQPAQTLPILIFFHFERSICA